MFGVVEMGHAVHAACLRGTTRFFEHVAGLPVEIVLRHIKQRFAFAIGIDGFVGERFPAKVHVRHHGEEFHIHGQAAAGGFDAVVVLVWWNPQTMLGGFGGYNRLGDVFGFREDQSNSAQILLRAAVGRVVDLEDQF